MKAISHLSSLRSKKRRERLEWLGDTVMEEAIVRLVAREAMATLERERGEETAAGGGGSEEEAEEKNVLPSLTSSTLSWRLDSAIRVAVSNANLGAVYGTQLVGLMGFLGLEEDHLGAPGGKRCRFSSFSSAGLLPPSLAAPTASERKADKLLPDLVESAIGEAFEASLALGLRTGLRSSGPQRFAGRHRAALVDRLLSSALCTEFVLANLDSRRGGGGWPAEGGGAMANSFGALDTDDDDDDDDSVDNGEKGEQEEEQEEDRREGDAEEEEEEEEKKEEEKEEDVVMGSGSRSLDPQGDADKDADAPGWAKATGEQVQATGEGGAAAVEKEVVQRGGSGNGGSGSDGSGGDSGSGSGGGSSSIACRRARNFASGTEAVLRLYGAALIKFRVSVFLYCSASGAASVGVAGAAGGGGNDEQGPSELTMRRQRVMCAENLEAVANYLRPAGEDGRAPPALGELEAPEASTARQWMRVAVGRAALCEGGDASFSTRVAALLLSRSGERGGPPQNGDNARFSLRAATAEGTSAQGGGRRKAKKLNRKEAKALTAAAAVEAASVAAATAEVQFRRDPWPERDLPRACEKAALMFRDRNSKADAGPNRAPPPAGLGHEDNPRAVSVRLRRGGDCQGDTSGDDSRDAFLVTCTPSTAPPPPSCAGKKRKRALEGGSSRAAGEPCLPPHYVWLVGGLPRDSRHLLARLGHQGYVKVLEEILDRFLYHSNAPPPDVQQGAAAAVATAAQKASAKHATLAACPRVKPRRVAADAATKSATGTIDTAAAVVGRADAACLQPPLDEAPNPWRAVQTGKPHPSLSGLVEPPELARTGPKRLVLPMPNPFYRRVLHALCRVHGLCSHGGETRGGGGGAGAERGKTVVRHRTVEITRIAAGGSRGRLRGRAESRAGVTALIPVETLLAAR